jgi:4-amino-4-deoxy-L-arabinose transferase-like glycosyltransferase
MPVAQVAVLEVTRADVDHHAFRPLYAVFFPVWLLLIYGGAAALAGRAAAAWTTLCAALLSFPAFAGAGGAASAYSDLPLACFFGAGLLLLLRPRLRLSAGLAAGILLAAAVLTKAEGEILAPVALALAVFFRRRLWRRHLRWRPLALAALPVGLALVLLLSWRARIPESFESFEQATSPSLLWPGIVTRIPQLARDVRDEMVQFLDWGLFWSVAPLVLIAGWRGLRRRPALPLILAAGVPLGVGWVYATISLKPDFMVKATWNRFLLQASVPLLVLFALSLRDLLRRAAWLPRGLGGPGRFQGASASKNTSSISRAARSQRNRPA